MTQHQTPAVADTWNGAPCLVSQVDGRRVVTLPEGHAELGYAPGSQFIEDVADTAGGDTMDQAFDAIRTALTAARAAGRAEAKFIHDNGRPGMTSAARARHIADLGHTMHEANSVDRVAQVAMWNALYSALSDVAGK